MELPIRPSKSRPSSAMSSKEAEKLLKHNIVHQINAFFSYLELDNSHFIRIKMEKSGKFASFNTDISGLASSEIGSQITTGQSWLDTTLRRIFGAYCQYREFAGADFSITMTGSDWMRLFRDCNILSKTFTTGHANVVFVAACGANGGGRDTRLSYGEFRWGLKLAADARFPKIEPLAALRQLLMRHILPNAKRMTEAESYRFLSPETRSIFYRYGNSLKRIFMHYNDIEVTEVLDRGKVTWEDVSSNDDTMSYNEFMRFCCNFDIVPGLVSNHAVCRIFRHVTLLMSSSSETESALGYAQFCEALGRIALEACTAAVKASGSRVKPRPSVQHLYTLLTKSQGPAPAPTAESADHLFEFLATDLLDNPVGLEEQQGFGWQV